MAKKKVDIVITDKELTPTIIGKLDTKEKSPVLLIFIFIIFIAVAIFLPDITNYVEKLMHGNTSNNKVNVPNNPNKDNTEIPEEEEELTYYDYAEGLVIESELFNITNIKKTDTTIAFDITNKTETELVLDNYKYYLEVYSSDTTLLQRIKISFGTIAAKETKNYIYDLDQNTSISLAKLLVVEKTTDDYPEVTLTINEDQNGVLTCTKNTETITYTFGNDYLVNISHVVNYPFSNDIEYTANLQDYQLKAATYNNYEGTSSTLITNEIGFTYTLLIDLRNADVKQFENNNYYDYRTLSKIVKFETEANGYSCN